MSIPSSEYFVIKPKSGNLPAGLPAEAAGSTGLYIFRSPAPDVSAREQWDQLIRQYGDQIDFASPVILDGQGQQLLPTGKIVVQFHEPPSRETLHLFEDSHGLRYLKTNEFKREQLSFEARDNKTIYQPDLIAKLKDDPNVRLAVPETMARFQRV
ncbi:MAG TPA: hypothetical protein VGK22_08495 [Candidatus Angelobacter sp.]|jgi:hypothetical protein